MYQFFQPDNHRSKILLEEFKYNQKLLICLQELKPLIQNNISLDRKRQHLQQHAIPEPTQEILAHYSLDDLQQTVQKLMERQNKISHEHHIYTSLHDTLNSITSNPYRVGP